VAAPKSALPFWDRTGGYFALAGIVVALFVGGLWEIREADESRTVEKSVREMNGRLRGFTNPNWPPEIETENVGDHHEGFRAITSVMRRYLPELKKHHKELLRVHPSAGGKMTVEMTVKADGTVAEARILNSDFRQYPKFEAAILGVIRTVNFEPMSGDAKIAFPFLFSVND